MCSWINVPHVTYSHQKQRCRSHSSTTCVLTSPLYRSPALYIISFSPSRPLACVVSKTTSFTDRHILRNTLHNCQDGSRLLRCFRPNKKSYGCRYKKIVSLVTYKSKNYIFHSPRELTICQNFHRQLSQVVTEISPRQEPGARGRSEI